MRHKFFGSRVAYFTRSQILVHPKERTLNFSTYPRSVATPRVIQDSFTFFSPSSLTTALLGLQIHWSGAFLLHGPLTIHFKTSHWPVISCHSSLTKREQNLAAKRHISKINSWQGAKIITKKNYHRQKLQVSESSAMHSHVIPYS